MLSCRDNEQASDDEIMVKLPEGYREAYSQDEIRVAVHLLGARLSEWVDEATESTGQQPLFLGVLRGGFLFLADLVRAIPRSVQADFIRCQSYDVATNRPDTEIQVQGPSVSVKGRAVLLVDDICDSGRTLQHLTWLMLRLGARNVRSAVLIYREQSPPEFVPDEICFRHHGSEWFVGYGMDDHNERMNLPSVYLLQHVPAPEAQNTEATAETGERLGEEEPI
jgi:hypoxanthine phosphoribosyltransferase